VTEEPYAQLRPLLFSIAYRMVGSVSEAEDIVQEAFLRHHRARREETEIGSPRAWLSAVTTRLAIDHLRSARVRRETYVGTWLPEPLLTDPAPGPGEHAELADSLSIAFLTVLERLTPVERAVFLLRDVFAFPYDEIAGALERSEESVRQLASRARRRIDEQRPRFAVPRERQEELTDRFVHAVQTGDADELLRMLAEDAVAYTDGGGKARAAPRPIHGRDRVTRLLASFSRPGGGLEGLAVRRAEINGQPGRITVDPAGRVVGAVVLDVGDGLVQAVRIVVNPDKLRHLQPRGA